MGQCNESAEMQRRRRKEKSYPRGRTPESKASIVRGMRPSQWCRPGRINEDETWVKALALAYEEVTTSIPGRLWEESRSGSQIARVNSE